MLQPWKWLSFTKAQAKPVIKLSQFSMVRNHLYEFGEITTLYAKQQKLHRVHKEIYKLRTQGYTIKTQYFFSDSNRHVKYTLISTPLMEHELGI